MQPPPHVCRRAFTRSWDDFGIATFFAPILIPGGNPELGERDAAPTLRFERKGREFELSGDVRCHPQPWDDNSPFAATGMLPHHLIGRLKLVEVKSHRVLGQWNEILVQDMSISCDVAFRKPTRPEKMAAARLAWGQRIEAALDAP
jgi:hypothetical protein